MKNLAQMMKQAQAMQEKMAEVQAELENDEITGSSGGGLVTVVLNGKTDLRRVKIDPSIVDPEDAGMLEDLIVAAHADAKTKVQAHVEEKMRTLTGGLNLPPGLNLPF